jgi:hypothetical protein
MKRSHSGTKLASSQALPPPSDEWNKLARVIADDPRNDDAIRNEVNRTCHHVESWPDWRGSDVGDGELYQYGSDDRFVLRLYRGPSIKQEWLIVSKQEATAHFVEQIAPPFFRDDLIRAYSGQRSLMARLQSVVHDAISEKAKIAGQSMSQYLINLATSEMAAA